MNLAMKYNLTKDTRISESLQTLITNIENEESIFLELMAEEGRLFSNIEGADDVSCGYLFLHPNRSLSAKPVVSQAYLWRE